MAKATHAQIVRALAWALLIAVDILGIGRAPSSGVVYDSMSLSGQRNR